MNLLHPGFLLPDYIFKPNLIQIPNTVMHTFGIPVDQPILSDDLADSSLLQRPRKLFWLWDGFGFSDLMYYRADLAFPLLSRLISDGYVCQGTTTYPSTTPLGVPAAQTGMKPQDGRVFEFGTYWPCLGIINPIMLSNCRYRERDELVKRELLTPADLYPHPTIYQRLAEQDVASAIITETEYVDTAFNQHFQRGATQVYGYSSPDELAAQAVSWTESSRDPGYAFVYFSGTDSTSHSYGPYSQERRSAVAAILDAFERFLNALSDEVAAETAVIVSSDHGQVPVVQENFVWLDQDPLVAELVRLGENGEPLVTGAPGCVGLYAQKGEANRLYNHLKYDLLRDKAWVMTTAEARRTGLFGPHQPIGDILIQPYPERFVWWGEFGQKGIHGGLDRRCMEIPIMLLDPQKIAHRTKIIAVKG